MQKPRAIGPKRRVTVLFAALLTSIAAKAAASAELPPPSIQISTWPRMSSQDFGCYLEKTFGYRDKHFNCSLKHYENKGDPCKNTDAYYEGPAFPNSLAAKVHPLATYVELEWEHGDLQRVTVTLKGRWNESSVRKAFQLPRSEAIELSDAELRGSPTNLMDTSVQYPRDAIDESIGSKPSDASRGETAVMLIGFDHLGAGDVACGNDN